MRNIRGKQTADDWKEGFYPVIIERGEKYFAEGRIRNHWQKEGRIYATVDGTQEYEVWIDPFIVEGGCTCPYAKGGMPCKHMAAMWIAVDEGAIIWDKPSSVEVPPVEHKFYNLPWPDAVDELPAELLRKELMRIADQDEDLQERLVLLNEGRAPEGLAEDWRESLLDISDYYADRLGYIEREMAEEFFTDLSNFVESKQPLLIKLGAFEDAFKVVRMAGEAAKRRPLYEAEQIELILFTDQCLAIIEEIGSAAPALKEEMEQWHKDFFDIHPEEYVFPIYEIKFIDEVPHYRVAGQEEWKEAPFIKWARRSDPEWARHYYDPIENHFDFKRIEPRVRRKANAALGELAGCFGSCHALWHEMKKIFKEEYGIDWHSAVDMNPDWNFD